MMIFQKHKLVLSIVLIQLLIIIHAHFKHQIVVEDKLLQN